jgi:hypothetical protein
VIIAISFRNGRHHPKSGHQYTTGNKERQFCTLGLAFQELQNSSNDVWGNCIDDPRILDVMLRRAAVSPNARALPRLLVLEKVKFDDFHDYAGRQSSP